MAEGFKLRHATDRNCIRVVPIMTMPIPTAAGHIVKVCPTCQIHHPVKCLHLGLGPAGEVMVSKGVLDLMQGRAEGMDGFTLEGSTKKPPTLRVGRNADRAQVDNENRAQVVYGSNLTTIETPVKGKRKAS